MEKNLLNSGVLRYGITLLFSVLTLATTHARGRYDNTDTLTVAQDGTAEFSSINDAIEVCRAFMEYRKVIFIKNGTYREKVLIPSWLTNIELLGEDRDSTIITWDDHANKSLPPAPSLRRGSATSLPTSNEGSLPPAPSNEGSVLEKASPLGGRLEGAPIGTFRTYTLKIEGSDIVLRNLTVENNAPQVGQAVALHTEGDRLLFVNCRFLGFQDTVYAGVARTRLYFKDCFICGTTDFIFGPSTAWFENCTIHSKADSYVTAASTPSDVSYGYIFNHCRLTAEPTVTKVYLGRPWRAYAHTLFMHCTLGSHIVAAGWQNWKDYHDPAAEGTVRYEEYQNSGLGAQPQQRVGWSRQLSDKEAAAITPATVFGGDIDWILF